MEFKKAKQEILELAKSKNACNEGVEQAKKSRTKKQILQAVLDNFNWCYNNKIVTVENLDKWFGGKLCESMGVFWLEKTYSFTGKVYAFGSSSVKAFGSSIVKAYDSSIVKAYDSSSVEAFGSSSVEAYDSSSVEAYDSSSVKAYGSSSVLIDDWSNNNKDNVTIADYALLKDIKEKKIYIKKSKFEIVEL